MTQRAVPAVFVRGGTSKGLLFHAADLPTDPVERDRLLLAALGSPDPYGRQLDGLGGGSSSLSKAAVIGPPTREDADVDYTFAQIAVDAPVVDYGANCGNLSAAVGPFAVDEGLVPTPADGEILVRIHNTNTGKVIESRFCVVDGRAAVTGALAVPGVAGTGAPVRLDFLDPAGSRTGALLPTGRPADELHLADGRTVRASLVDASNPVVIVLATDVGLTAVEHPDALDADAAAMSLLDQVRRAGGVAMGLGRTTQDVPLSNPKIAVVAPPAPSTTLAGHPVDAQDCDLLVRMVSMEKAHRAVTVTGALCLGVAARVPGTLPHAIAGRAPQVRLASPSGVVVVDAVMVERDGAPHPVSATLLRTTRRLMQGAVLVPQ
jgi:2-methylaconitate isomerase